MGLYAYLIMVKSRGDVTSPIKGYRFSYPAVIDLKTNLVSTETNVNTNETLATRPISSNRTKYVIGPERII